MFSNANLAVQPSAEVHVFEKDDEVLELTAELLSFVGGGEGVVMTT